MDAECDVAPRADDKVSTTPAGAHERLGDTQDGFLAVLEANVIANLSNVADDSLLGEPIEVTRISATADFLDWKNLCEFQGLSPYVLGKTGDATIIIIHHNYIFVNFYIFSTSVILLKL